MLEATLDYLIVNRWPLALSLSGYIRHIDEQSDKRLFIEAIFRATNSIDLPLIAEMVETKGELEVIRELGLFGGDGTFDWAAGADVRGTTVRLKRGFTCQI